MVTAVRESKDYECRQCGYRLQDSNVKRGMITHLGHEDNTQCLELYSKSSDQREMDLATAASEYECLDLYSKSSDAPDMDWVRLVRKRKQLFVSRVNMLRDTILELLLFHYP